MPQIKQHLNIIPPTPKNGMKSGIRHLALMRGKSTGGVWGVSPPVGFGRVDMHWSDGGGVCNKEASLSLICKCCPRLAQQTSKFSRSFCTHPNTDNAHKGQSASANAGPAPCSPVLMPLYPFPMYAPEGRGGIHTGTRFSRSRRSNAIT